MLPVWGLMLQMYPAPPPVAENCVDPPAARLTVAGVTVIDAGLSWMVTEADLVGFWMEAAVMVTVCRLVIVAGGAELFVGGVLAPGGLLPAPRDPTAGL